MFYVVILFLSESSFNSSEVLLREEQAKFIEWQKSLPYVEVMTNLQKKFEAVRQDEIAKVEKTRLQNLSKKELKNVHALSTSINKKLLHGPMSYLRSSDAGGNKASVEEIEQVAELHAALRRRM